MSHERNRELILELGRKIGLGDIAPDADGYLSLEIDGLAVHFQHDAEEDELVLFARLGEAAPDRLEEIYGQLLAANLFWQGSRRATFSGEPEDGIVFIADRMPLERLDIDRLETWLGAFVDIAEHWQGYLNRAAKGEPLDDAEPENGPGGDGAGLDGGLPPAGIIRV
jgi:hypothetical protein